MSKSITANVQGFVQVGDFEFRLLENVSQIYGFKLMICCFDEQRSVELELKLNWKTKVELRSVKPNLHKTLCWAKFFPEYKK